MVSTISVTCSQFGMASDDRFKIDNDAHVKEEGNGIDKGPKVLEDRTCSSLLLHNLTCVSQRAAESREEHTCHNALNRWLFGGRCAFDR